MHIQPSSLIGMNLYVKFGESIPIFPSVGASDPYKGVWLGQHSDNNMSGDGYFTVTDIAVTYQLPNNLLWIKFEDPERTDWVIYIDDFFTTKDGSVISIDQAAIDAIAPGLFASTVGAGLHNVFDTVGETFKAAIPDSWKVKLQEFSKTMQNVIITAAILIFLWLIYKIYKIFFDES